MIYIPIFLTLILSASIFLIIYKNNKNKIQFEIKIEKLENIIRYLTKNLEVQSQKIKLSDDLKLTIQTSNQTLSKKIVDMNMEMFAEMFPKK
ncbi:MAG: hypothetical protein H7174_10115 [Flavobacterium sp.]|nr:hypothetical protein [Flavobacterium sp.]